MAQQEIKKKLILVPLSDGNWILDKLCLIVRDKLSLEMSLIHNQALTIKELSILYFSNISINPLPRFPSSFGIEAEDFLKSKSNGAQNISEFSESEKLIINKAILKIENICAGHINFLTSLSFVKFCSVGFRSSSNPHMIGVIFLTDKVNYTSVDEVALSIIHELGHQELFLINFFDKLTISGDQKLTVFSPYQGKPRPPIGRLHSLCAVYRMIQYSIYAKIEYQILLEQFWETTKTLNEGHVTNFGASLISVFEDYVNSKNL